jgi:hypothetical protein
MVRTLARRSYEIRLNKTVSTTEYNICCRTSMPGTVLYLVLLMPEYVHSTVFVPRSATGTSIAVHTFVPRSIFSQRNLWAIEYRT